MSFIPNFRPLKQAPDQDAIYLQIVVIISGSIAQGQLLQGEKLPSSRVMAKKFQVGRQTVLNALNELIAQGWILSKERAGYYVAEQLSVAKNEQ